MYILDFIGIQLIYNIVLVSGVQQSESIIHVHAYAYTYTYTCFQVIFAFRPLQIIEQSSLRYTVGPYQLSDLYMGFPGGSVVKNRPANADDTGSIPELGRSPG